jgi:hypothetical protein
VVRVVLQRDTWVFHLGEIGRILLTPRLSKWHGSGLIRFVLTPVRSRLLTLSLSLSLVFDFAGGRHGKILLIDSGYSRHMTRDQRLVLQPHPGDDQRVHHFFGQWERQSAFSGHGEGE